MSKRKQGFVGGAMILLLSNIIVKIVGALFKIPLSNVIEDVAMGYFNVAYHIYATFFLISTAGLPVAISRMIAAAKAKARGKEVERIYRVSLVLFIVIGLIGTACLFFGAELLAKLSENPEVAICLKTISPIMFFICVASCVRGYFQGLQNMTPTAISQVVEVMGNLCIGLTLGYWAHKNGYPDNQVAAFVLVGVTVGVILSALYLLFAKAIAKRDKESGLLENEEVRSGKAPTWELIRIAIPITVSASVLSLNSVIDSIMAVQRMESVGVGLDFVRSLVKDGETAMAVYGAYSAKAVTLFNVPPTIAYPFAISIIPAISAALARNDHGELKRTMDFTFRIVTVICLPMAVGMGVMSRPIIDMLFTDRGLFETAGGAVVTSNQFSAVSLSILCVAILLSGLVSVSGAMLQAYGHEQKSIISTALGVLVKFVTVYFFMTVPFIGAYGIALSTLACYVVMFTFNMIFMLCFVKYRPGIRKIFLRPFLASALCGGSAMGVYLLLKLIIPAEIANIGRFSVSAVISTVGGILVGAVVYVISLFLLKGFEKDDVLQLPKGEKILKILVKFHLLKA